MVCSVSSIVSSAASSSSSAVKSQTSSASASNSNVVQLNRAADCSKAVNTPRDDILDQLDRRGQMATDSDPRKAATKSELIAKQPEASSSVSKAGEKRQSSPLMSQALAAAVSQPTTLPSSCASAFHSVRKEQSLLSSTSAVTTSISQQSYGAIMSEVAVPVPAASTSHVCIKF